MPEERIQKLLAAAGIASRRGAEALIEKGRVTVDGRVASLGDRADAETARIAVDGREIAVAPLRAPVYLALHKPAGVTSTVRDRHAARTVVDLVPADLRPAGRLFPVGRLDRDSEGLILLSDDGPWSERVLHPRFGVEREYAVGLDRPLDDAQLERLRAGVALEEGIARFVGLRAATKTETTSLASTILPPPDSRLTWYRVTLAQGWKRQVRRMLAAIGAPVRRLVRVRVGSVRLATLRAGEARPLSPAEVRSLASRAAAPPSSRRPSRTGPDGASVSSRRCPPRPTA
jgi:23S rRNA pseudouridine2605 synthase